VLRLPPNASRSTRAMRRCHRGATRITACPQIVSPPRCHSQHQFTIDQASVASRVHGHRLRTAREGQRAVGRGSPRDRRGSISDDCPACRSTTLPRRPAEYLAVERDCVPIRHAQIGFYVTLLCATHLEGGATSEQGHRLHVDLQSQDFIPPMGHCSGSGPCPASPLASYDEATLDDLLHSFPRPPPPKEAAS
jgi:hypothetical protein